LKDLKTRRSIRSYKAEQIRELGAAFSVQADLLELESQGAAQGNAAAYDIASILGIALDNAADAVVAITTRAAQAANAPVEMRAIEARAGIKVDCRIQLQKNMLMMYLSNPLPGPLRYKNGEIQSTKAESGHGLGLPMLRRIVRKYDGDAAASDSGGVFCLSVMLYV
jgi:sensor histidine kinase regulating citrate/malate metabolism